jgi:hypothetical protein
LLLPLAFLGVLAFSLVEATLRRQQCLAACYFLEGTWLRRLFSRALLHCLIAVLIAVTLTTVIAINLAMRPLGFFWLLAADIVAVVLLVRAVQSTLRTKVAPRMLSVVTRSWVSALNGVLLLAALIAMTLFSNGPPYQDRELFNMLAGALNASVSRCPSIELVLQAAAAKDALAWWAILSTDSQFDTDLSTEARLGAWMIFLISDALSAFAFSRLITQIVHWASKSGDQNVHNDSSTASNPI